MAVPQTPAFQCDVNFSSLAQVAAKSKSSSAPKMLKVPHLQAHRTLSAVNVLFGRMGTARAICGRMRRALATGLEACILAVFMTNCKLGICGLPWNRMSDNVQLMQSQGINRSEQWCSVAGDTRTNVMHAGIITMLATMRAIRGRLQRNPGDCYDIDYSPVLNGCIYILSIYVCGFFRDLRADGSCVSTNCQSFHVGTVAQVRRLLAYKSQY
jgi:hypothetical protein